MVVLLHGHLNCFVYQHILSSNGSSADILCRLLRLETVYRNICALDTIAPGMYQTVSDIFLSCKVLDLRQAVQFWNTSTPELNELFGVMSETIRYIAGTIESKLGASAVLPW